MERGKNVTFRVTSEWKSQGKISRGRARKKSIDVVEEDLKTTKVEDCRNVIQNRER